MKIFLYILLFLLPTLSFSQTWEELNQQISEHYQKGEYQHATIIAEQALDVCATEYGKEHEYYSISLNNLAGLYDILVGTKRQNLSTFRHWRLLKICMALTISCTAGNKIIWGCSMNLWADMRRHLCCINFRLAMERSL